MKAYSELINTINVLIRVAFLYLALWKKQKNQTIDRISNMALIWL